MQHLLMQQRPLVIGGYTHETDCEFECSYVLFCGKYLDGVVMIMSSLLRGSSIGSLRSLRDEMSEVVSHCLFLRQLWLSNWWGSLCSGLR